MQPVSQAELARGEAPRRHAAWSRRPVAGAEWAVTCADGSPPLCAIGVAAECNFSGFRLDLAGLAATKQRFRADWARRTGVDEHGVCVPRTHGRAPPQWT